MQRIYQGYPVMLHDIVWTVILIYHGIIVERLILIKPSN